MRKRDPKQGIEGANPKEIRFRGFCIEGPNTASELEKAGERKFSAREKPEK